MKSRGGGMSRSGVSKNRENNLSPLTNALIIGPLLFILISSLLYGIFYGKIYYP